MTGSLHDSIDPGHGSAAEVAPFSRLLHPPLLACAHPQ
jgi:hypothetical protein